MNDNFSLNLSEFQNLEKEYRILLKNKLDTGKVNKEYIQVNSFLLKLKYLIDIFILV